MSDLSLIKELLEKKCLCHETDLNYALESMPNSIAHPPVKQGCDCKHGQEKAIKQALRKFKTFIETKAKFKLGDRVELAVTPVINERDSFGWLGSKHFLVEGAKATVADVDFRGDSFGYSIIFDDESWKDRDGVVRPIEKKHKHTYYFGEKKIRSVNSSSGDFLKKLWSDFYRIGD
jgi:hypothetical protein